MYLSFALTAEAIIEDIKWVTRRFWAERTIKMWQKAFDNGRLVHDAYDKSPRNGGKVIGKFYLTARPYLERLGDISKEDLVAEATPAKTPEEFCQFVGRSPDEMCVVIRFRKLPEFETVDWDGCFDEHLTNYIVHEARQHPAKMAAGVAFKMAVTLRDHYGVASGAHVLEPFMGIGTTGIFGIPVAGWEVTGIDVNRQYVNMVNGMHCIGLKESLDIEDPYSLCPKCFSDLPHLKKNGIPTDFEKLKYYFMPHYYRGNRQLLEDRGSGDWYTTEGMLQSIHGDNRQILSNWRGRRFDGAMWSPPFEDTLKGGEGASSRWDKTRSKGKQNKRSAASNYGKDKGQMGNSKGARYWRQISETYRAVASVLPHGAPIAVNVKDFVRKGTIVPFSLNTLVCLMHNGFDIDFLARAWLINRMGQLSLFGEETITEKAKESKWRREMRKKGLGIDYELIIFGRRNNEQVEV